MSSVTLALLATAFVSTQAAEPQVLLPGLLDFPLIGGVVISPDCGGDPTINPGDGLVCVAFPAGGDLDELRNRYGQIAMDQGWRVAFALEATTVHFERPAAGGRCDHLAIAYSGANGGLTALALIVDHDMPCVRGAAS